MPQPSEMSLVRSPVSSPFARVAVFIVLQAVVWLLVALTFAMLIQAAGWSRWEDALYFSAVNWLPWIVIAPLIFWLARKFPFEPRRLLRSIPVHVAACACCVLLTLALSAYFAPRPNWTTRPPGENRDRERGPAPTGTTAQTPANTGPAATPSTENTGATSTAATHPSTELAIPGETNATPGMTQRQAGERQTGERRWSGGRDGGQGGTGGGGGGGRFRRPPPTPPPPDSVPALLRQWAFLGSFWAPFSTAQLRVNFSVAVYLIVACVATAVGYYRRAQERERDALALSAGLTRAKLDALRGQLQPHFLFNTLNAISTLVHRNPDAADELIADLSELLRLSLKTSEDEVPLARELELLKCYLSIEQTRLGDRLRIEQHIDPAATQVLVPTFILQPLAENAVRHGIEPRRATGTITITAKVEGAQLRLAVADDGVGLKSEKGQAPSRGVGLSNTEERLRTLHGAKAAMTIESPAKGGVSVEIVVPLRRMETKAAAKA